MNRAWYGRILSYGLLFVCLYAWAAIAEEPTTDTTVSYPHIWNLLNDQWTSGNQEAVRFYGVYLEKYKPSETTPVQLSLKESIALALSGNLEVSAQRVTPQVAATGIMSAKGPYDFHITSDAGQNVSKVPISSILQNTQANYLETLTTSFDIGVNKVVQTGGRLELKLDAQRLRANSSFLILNPAYATHLNFSLAQPLLKNAGLAFNRANIQIAQNLHLMSEERLKGFIIDTVSTIEQAYWELVFAFQNREVRKESLALAKDLLNKNEMQVKLGTMAPIDTLQAKTGVALREEELITSEGLLESTQDRFKDLLQISAQTKQASVFIIPTDTPRDPPQQEVSTLEEDIRVALQNRSEYQAGRKDLQNKNLQIKIAENQLLPSLDLTGTIGLNGLGGNSMTVDNWPGFLTTTGSNPLDSLLILLGAEPFPQATSPLDGGLNRSFKELYSGDFYQWALGLRFDIPLENRSAKAIYQKAKLEAYQTSVSMKSLEEKIALEVKEANRTINTSRQRIKTSQVSQQLAREQLVAEQKKLAVGLSTNYQVLKMEEDLRNAQVNALKTRIDYWKAKVMLERARGTLLENENITIENLPPKNNRDTT